MSRLFPILAVALICGCASGKAAPPAAAVPHRVLAYVTNNAEHTVSVIDVATGQEIATVNMGHIGARLSYPAFVAAATDGSKVYVANLNTASVNVVDTATNEVVKRIDLGHPPRSMAVTPDGRKLYVAGDGDVAYAIDVATDTLAARVPLGQASLGVAIAPDGKRAYFTMGEGNVAVVDVATDAMVDSISDLRGAAGIAIAPDGASAYVLRNDIPGRVYVVDLASGRVTADIRVDSSPVALVVSHDGRFLYVVNRGADTVSVVDTQAREAVTTIAAGSVPTAIALSADGKELYVTASGSGQIYVLSPESRSVIAKIRLDRKASPRPTGIVLIGAN